MQDCENCHLTQYTLCVAKWLVRILLVKNKEAGIDNKVLESKQTNEQQQQKKTPHKTRTVQKVRFFDTSAIWHTDMNSNYIET